ncbi:MAG TPA: GHMP kinase, partial [Terriglobia bacterium]|nr:GHMP kinase [Terriglobia bacterium]
MSDEITAFVDAIKLTGFFDQRAAVILARAPGRLDVMGGIADYSGSLVLQRTIAEATFAALQRTDARILNVVSLSPDPNEIPRVFAIPMDSLGSDVEPIPYSDARELFRNVETRWAAYVIGVFLVLMRERRVAFPQGSKILISSRVPEAKGVASSAALEVAVMQAVITAFDFPVDAQEMAVLCQKVENLVAGAPCGIMDQMTAVCGEAGSLLSLLCQPAQLQSPVRVPETLEFWGLDSGERHAVSGSDYTSVRTGAFMGFRMIAEASDEAPDDYLANVSPVDFARDFVSLLPEEISGAEFLKRFARIDDTVTSVDPGRVYK